MPLKDSENEKIVILLHFKYICVYSVTAMFLPVRRLKYNVMNVRCSSTVGLLATLVNVSIHFHAV